MHLKRALLSYTVLLSVAKSLIPFLPQSSVVALNSVRSLLPFFPGHFNRYSLHTVELKGTFNYLTE